MVKALKSSFSNKIQGPCSVSAQGSENVNLDLNVGSVELLFSLYKSRMVSIETRHLPLCVELAHAGFLFIKSTVSKCNSAPMSERKIC